MKIVARSQFALRSLERSASGVVVGALGKLTIIGLLLGLGESGECSLYVHGIPAHAHMGVLAKE